MARNIDVSRGEAAESDTRLAIIRAASQLIAHLGIEGASMRQIAEASGLSMGTINHHFGSKQGLVIAAMDEAYRLGNWAQMDEASPANRLRRLLDTYVLETPALRAWWQFWVEYVAHAGREPEFERRHRERYERQLRYHCRLLREGIEKGEFRADLDVERTAHTLLGLFNGIAVNQVAGGLSAEDARAVLQGQLEAIFAATPRERVPERDGRGD